MAGLFGTTTTSSSTTASTSGDISKDAPISNPPEDGISDLSFSSAADFLAVASWDKKTRIYEIDGNGQSQGKAMIEHEGPVLSCAWSKDGTKIASAGADKAVRMLDLAANTGKAQQVAAHDEPIRSIRFVDVQGQAMLVSGGWDKKVKYWDLRQSTPVATLDCQERVYTMDSKDNLLVIGTADRYINIVNLTQPGTFYKTMQSPLKWQTRVVSCFTDATGFAVGSIEGRCAIQYVEDKDSSSNFSFKCHREQASAPSRDTQVYSVNAISFHPVHGTFSTAGSDGTFHFWDKDAKHRLKGYPPVGGPISCTAFNRTGTIFAYGVSYDWSKGYSANNPQTPNKIMLHPVNQEEIKPRQVAKKR
ncbi:MAG: RNA export factor gle2 [Cirrosporium novae-zelandiae]|nr:MAG: RNA export factor gle2 [Cirrosporium novae-zelandiae]